MQFKEEEEYDRFVDTLMSLWIPCEISFVFAVLSMHIMGSDYLSVS